MKKIFIIFILLYLFGLNKNIAQTLTDIDGNVYKTIKIGTQIWMAENLKTTKYRNGTVIPNIKDSTVWYNLSKGAYCNYNNKSSNSSIYGKLYNWYAVKDGRNICPVGWHVPTNDEWGILITYLGEERVSGGKLKEADTTHWQNPNTGATNETGFTALPGGSRYFDGSFNNIGEGGYWWSSTKDYNIPIFGKSVCMGCKNSSAHIFSDNISSGFSVRCIKDK